MTIQVAQPESGAALAWRALAPRRAVPTIAAEIHAGLLAEPRSLPSRCFYDALGSELFDRICDLPEYYLTRLEDELLARNARAIIARVQPARIVELGSGTSRKTRRLFAACESLALRPRYIPVDVSLDAVRSAASALRASHPWLRIDALIGDYGAGLPQLPPIAAPTLHVFLGSTLGNLDYAAAAAFLADVAASMAAGDRLLLGLDRAKDPAVLHAAYNDSSGLTARFNANVMSVVNDLLGADFDPDAFDHYAPFNPQHSRIEMYLISRQARVVNLSRLDLRLQLVRGEPILTEISCKYSAGQIAALLEGAGLECEAGFDAPRGWFSLLLLRRAR